MNTEETIRKLKTMPWQALFDLAVKYQVEEEELKGKEKDEVIRRLLLTDELFAKDILRYSSYISTTAA